MCTQTNNTSGTSLLTAQPASDASITGSLAFGLGGLHRLDDRAVHPVRDRVRELDADVLEARSLEPRLVLALRERSGDATDVRAALAPFRRGQVSSATMSLIPMRPPGLRTRAISVSTAGLSTDRLMTQLEITTSTEFAGSGICSITPLRKCVRDTGVARVLLGKREHLVRHVQPVGDTGRPDPLGRQDHVDSAAGAEVEHGLALVEICDSGRVAAPERGQCRRLRQLAALLGVVQRLAEGTLLTVTAGVSAAAAVVFAPASARFRCSRGLGIAAPHLLTQLIGWSPSAARSFQVGNGRQRVDGVALQREIGPLATLLALEQATSVSFFRW